MKVKFEWKNYPKEKPKIGERIVVINGTYIELKMSHDYGKYQKDPFVWAYEFELLKRN